jgi:hypothetical protein
MTNNNIIKIPHSSKQDQFQEIDMTTCKRSQFQIDQLTSISQREEFEQFVLCQDRGQLWIVFPEFDCAFACLWYDKSNNLHLEKIGRRKVLRHFYQPPIDSSLPRELSPPQIVII